MKTVTWTAAIGCASVAAIGILFALSWVLTALGIFGPGNVKEQWRFAYDYDEALGAIALNVCSLEKVIADEPDPKVKAARQSQMLAYVQLYNTRAAEYDARLRDAFRAGLVRPPDVPEQAPTLDQKKAQVCS